MIKLYLYELHLSWDYDVFSAPLEGSELYCDCSEDPAYLVHEFEIDEHVASDNFTIYQTCVGEYYVTDEDYDDSDLYCPQCGDRDTYILTFKLSEVTATRREDLEDINNEPSTFIHTS